MSAIPSFCLSCGSPFPAHAPRLESAGSRTRHRRFPSTSRRTSTSTGIIGLAGIVGESIRGHLRIRECANLDRPSTGSLESDCGRPGAPSRGAAIGPKFPRPEPGLVGRAFEVDAAADAACEADSVAPRRSSRRVRGSRREDRRDPWARIRPWEPNRESVVPYGQCRRPLSYRCTLCTLFWRPASPIASRLVAIRFRSGVRANRSKSKRLRADARRNIRALATQDGRPGVRGSSVTDSE